MCHACPHLRRHLPLTLDHLRSWHSCSWHWLDRGDIREQEECKYCPELRKLEDTVVYMNERKSWMLENSKACAFAETKPHEKKLLTSQQLKQKSSVCRSAEPSTTAVATLEGHRNSSGHPQHRKSGGNSRSRNSGSMRRGSHHSFRQILLIRWKMP